MIANPRFINDTGLDALKHIAGKYPDVFLESDPDALEKRIVNLAETEDIWGSELDVRTDLAELNNIDVSGPETDSRFAPLVRHSLQHLPPAEGLNERRWATINCFIVPQYVSKRWNNALPKDEKRVSRFVERHWLNGAKVDAIQDNAIARLWWLTEFSQRAAKHSALYDENDILDAMANNVNLYHQFLSRPNLISRDKLIAAVYEVFLDDNDYLRTTKYASQLMSALNFLAAEVSLDFMDVAELREVVEEAKPPKEG